MTTSIVVVVNPAAGGGRAMRALPVIQGSLRRLDAISFQTRISDGPDDPVVLARRAAQEQADAVIAVGGDGLVGRVAEGLVGSETALCVVPAGTGNDFARSIGYPRPGSDIDWIIDAPRTRIDAGKIVGEWGERVFVNVAGAGFDAEVNERANAMPASIDGAPRYIVAALSTLRRFTPTRFRVTVDGVVHEREAMLVAVANGPTYGGGMRVAPDARVDDGQLDVCIVHAMSRRAFVTNFPRVFRGTHTGDHRITMLRGSRVDLEAPDARVYADGEFTGAVPVSITTLPGALQILEPPR